METSSVIISGEWFPANGIAGLNGVHILNFDNHFSLFTIILDYYAFLLQINLDSTYKLNKKSLGFFE